MCSFQRGAETSSPRIHSEAERSRAADVCEQARRVSVSVSGCGELSSRQEGVRFSPSSPLLLRPSGTRARWSKSRKLPGGIASLGPRQSGSRNRTSEPPNIVPSPPASTGAPEPLLSPSRGRTRRGVGAHFTRTAAGFVFIIISCIFFLHPPPPPSPQPPACGCQRAPSAAVSPRGGCEKWTVWFSLALSLPPSIQPASQAAIQPAEQLQPLTEQSVLL